MNLKIVSATKSIFEGKILSVTAPTTNGTVQILPHHIEFISTLEIGELCISTKKEEKYFVINGGFIQVQDDNIIILANEAESSSSIIKSEIDEAIRKSNEKIASDLPSSELIQLEKQIRYEKLKQKVQSRSRS